MKFTCHRINTIEELQKIPIEFGIEIDLRYNDLGDIILSHDYDKNGEQFNNFLKYYNHSFIILNVKSEGIEYKILDTLATFKIVDYFFLDCSFPMIYKLSKNNKNIAIRYSEFESKETILNMVGNVTWIWVDCFTKFPLERDTFNLFKDNGFKICIVSPELQNQPEKIEIYKQFLNKNDMIPDMICTKEYNIVKWK
jgi:predicted GTPase